MNNQQHTHTTFIIILENVIMSPWNFASVHNFIVLFAAWNFNRAPGSQVIVSVNLKLTTNKWPRRTKETFIEMKRNRHTKNKKKLHLFWSYRVPKHNIFDVMIGYKYFNTITWTSGQFRLFIWFFFVLPILFFMQKQNITQIYYVL